MAHQIEPGRAGKPSLLRRGVAGLVLVAAAVLVIHFAIGLIMAVFWIVLIVAVIGAALWAINELF